MLRTKNDQSAAVSSKLHVQLPPQQQLNSSFVKLSARSFVLHLSSHQPARTGEAGRAAHVMAWRAMKVRRQWRCTRSDIIAELHRIASSVCHRHHHQHRLLNHLRQRFYSYRSHSILIVCLDPASHHVDYIVANVSSQPSSCHCHNFAQLERQACNALRQKVSADAEPE